METTGKLVKTEGILVQDVYSQEQIMEMLRRLACNPGAVERLLQCADQLPAMARTLSSFEDRCRTTISRCDAIDLLCRNFLCPGNVNFSQRTLDEYSGQSLIKLDSIIKDLGDPYVNAFPVPPGKKIRMTHEQRPGYSPTSIRVDLNLANNGNNYSDITLEFFVGSKVMVHKIGNSYDGNMFLNKDGTQIEVKFPEYRNLPVDIGSLETLTVEISNKGPANNLNSAHINIQYDNGRFYELCKVRSGCGGSCAT